MLKTRQIIRRKTATLKHGPNVRSDLGSEEDLRRLGRSIKKQQRTPFLIYADGTVIDGNRSLAACLLEGVEEVDCVVVDADLSPAAYKAIQFASAVHRSDLSAYDKAVAVRDIKAESPGMTNKQIADDILDMDAALMTRLLALWDCIPDVQEAARLGKLCPGDWYAISRSPDQVATLDLKLKGATRDQMARSVKPKIAKPDTDMVKLEKLPVALNAGIVIIKARKGEQALNLTAARQLLVDALAKVDGAIKSGWSAKTAARAFDETKDRPAKEKKARKPRTTPETGAIQ